jgi:hypothetical protein
MCATSLLYLLTFFNACAIVPDHSLPNDCCVKDRTGSPPTRIYTLWVGYTLPSSYTYAERWSGGSVDIRQNGAARRLFELY